MVNPLVTFVGNATADLELRYTQNGVAVANGTVAVNDRVFDRQTNEFKDGPTTFVRFSAWRELGEHAAQSIKKGQQVILVGKLEQNEYTDKEGVKRTSFEVTAEHLAASVRFGTTEFRKSARPDQNAQAQAQYGQQGGGVQQQAQAAQAQGYTPAQQQAPGQYQNPPAQQMQQPPVQQQAPAQPYDQGQQYAQQQGQPVQQQAAPQQQAVPAGVPAAGANPFGPGATDGDMF
ncbi:single-stranded DNA-binding protein [Pseudoclavibacter sp. VKM Ac-2888]|uniref:single-stranded DNA-binding protein n=1 Tax=Pseudoclavibacter sp. VKM Ac-2888 TaxID=2783830 RepID=UPI001889F570|nr:single-stranded DNA-binding protein [Pseudoclavibacter sp. VKM Ac-2888]MBF4549367.1 single-stranded DNA-binding protein [Pseudoclavibacter sp. VKM Ac-2888]